MIPFEQFPATLRARFGGQLRHGSHQPDGEACLLEAAHAAVGDAWSDDPDRWPDLRPLNDAPWSSDALRTQHLVPVLAAFWHWEEWPETRRNAVMEQIALLTVQHLIANLPSISASIRMQCRAATTRAEAEAAAWAAWAAAGAAGAAGAAKAAAGAAEAAARAAEAAAGAAEADRILITACHLWIESARETT